MHVLAHEHIPKKAVDALRSRGHDVAWVRADAPGSTDRDVLDRCAAEERILLTFDPDLAALAYAAGLPGSFGLILFRFAPTSPSAVARTAVRILESRDDWAGHLAIVDEAQLRMIPIPPKGQAPATSD